MGWRSWSASKARGAELPSCAVLFSPYADLRPSTVVPYRSWAVNGGCDLTSKKDPLGKLKKRSERLNKKRNAIVHQGAFASKREMRELVNLSREIVNELVIPWEPEFVLGGEKLTSSKVPKAKKVLKATNAKGRKKKS